MNKKHFLLSAVAIAAIAALASFKPADGVMTKEGATTVVNTTTLTKNVRGFKAQTPVKIYISKGKVVKVEPLKNQETPQFFARAKAVLDKYKGKSVKKAADMKVDAVSGATYSSKALIKNVQEGVKYYQSHQ